MGKDLKGKELGVGLSQRKDKRYQARFTRRNGQRIEKNFPKLTEARNWLNEQKHLDTIIDTGDMTVDEWYEYWINNFKTGFVKDNTIRNYKIRYNQNIKKEIGKMKLSDVKQLDCQRILNKMSGKYAYGSIKLTRATLCLLFESAVENNYILKNPSDGLKIKQDKNEDYEDSETSEARVLTKTEQEIFKEYAEKTFYSNAYCLVLETGLRLGEISGLRWEDIDFDRNFLCVKRTVHYDKEKGGFYFGTPKSKSSKRKIPLTKEAVNILKKQKEIQNRLHYRCKNWNDTWDGLVFTTRNGNPVGYASFRDSIIRIVNTINCDRKCCSPDGKYEEFKHMGMHSLRHTFATRAIENGVQPKTLQKILGHSSLSITMDLYVHITDEQSYLEMEKMNIAI